LTLKKQFNRPISKKTNISSNKKEAIIEIKNSKTENNNKEKDLKKEEEKLQEKENHYFFESSKKNNISKNLQELIKKDDQMVDKETFIKEENKMNNDKIKIVGSKTGQNANQDLEIKNNSSSFSNQPNNMNYINLEGKINLPKKSENSENHIKKLSSPIHQQINTTLPNSNEKNEKNVIQKYEIEKIENEKKINNPVIEKEQEKTVSYNSIKKDTDSKKLFPTSRIIIDAAKKTESSNTILMQEDKDIKKQNELQKNPENQHYKVKSDSKKINNPIGNHIGLNNLGNTCFMNASIQCIFNCRSFMNSFVKSDFTQNSLAQQFKALYEAVYNQIGEKHEKITKFKLKIGQLREEYLGYNQQDAFEFVGNLLFDMGKELNKKIPEKKLFKLSDPYQLFDKSLEEYRTYSNLKSDSIIKNYFTSLLTHKITCQTCEKTTFSFEETLALSIPIPKSKSTIKSCLDDYFKEVEVDFYFCKNCQKESKVNRKSFFVKPAIHLIFHMKKYSQNGGVKVPNKQVIECQEEKFSIDDYVYGWKSGNKMQYHSI
jgi:ubiquitin C-terminal hydrolase